MRDFARGQPAAAAASEVAGAEATFTLEGKRIDNVLYPVEESRGYQARGDLWSPGYFRLTLRAGEPRDARGLDRIARDDERAGRRTQALDAERGRRAAAACAGRARGAGRHRARSSCSPPISSSSRPAGRTEETARARASGDEVRTVIAGYHWFTDWGRDTMISLEGLTLVTGRHVEAGYILRTFAHYVRDGLIPNMFPEGEKEGLYHTADATLWFFHAIDALRRRIRTIA